MFPPEDGRARVWPLVRGAGVSGDCSTLNISECPNDAVVSSLSDVLEAHVHPRFFLSRRAAQGILRRAAARGRALPPDLLASLVMLAANRTTPPKPGISSPTPSPAVDSTPARTEQDGEPRLLPTAFHATQTPVSGDVSPSLGAQSTSAVSFAENQRHELLESQTAGSLSKGGGKPGRGYAAARIGAQVRRLTPTECERLMGWPDGWTVL